MDSNENNSGVLSFTTIHLHDLYFFHIPQSALILKIWEIKQRNPKICSGIPVNFKQKQVLKGFFRRKKVLNLKKVFFPINIALTLL